MASTSMRAQGTKTARLPVEPRLTEAQFLNVAAQLPDWTLEYSAQGNLTFMPPTDPITSRSNGLIVHRLNTWAEQNGCDNVSGPDGGFLLPDGSRMAPDAAWFSEKRWQAAQVPNLRFPVFVPEFVLELRSPFDRRRVLEEKMQVWLDNGVNLAWLIDPSERTVTIYRPDTEPEVLKDPTEVNGDGPLEGFTLPLDRIFPSKE